MTTRFDKAVLDYFTIDTLPNHDMREVARAVGIDTAIRLMNSELAGHDVHVPQTVSPVVVRKFHSDHRELTIDDVARAFNISQRSVYNYIRRCY